MFMNTTTFYESNVTSSIQYRINFMAISHFSKKLSPVRCVGPLHTIHQYHYFYNIFQLFNLLLQRLSSLSIL